MMLLRPRFSSSPSPSPRRSPPPAPSGVSSSYPALRSSGHRRRRRPRTRPASPPPPADLRRLTSRIVDLTRRRQLSQIMEEVDAARRRTREGGGGAGAGLNTIVMNAVLEACVRCGDVDLALRLFDEMRRPGGCGVDGVSYGVLLKGLGIARRIDDAFEILESIEKDTSTGSPRLSPHLLCGFLNALIEAGDMRRANALVARFREVLYKGHSVLLYNLLMKGYIKSNFPLGALTVKDEILRQGLKPDRLTYNTIISACVTSAEIDMAIRFLEDMKEEANRDNNPELLPDAVTYTTLLKGLGNSRDLYSVLKIVVEMKSSRIFIDRTAYTAMIDALLACGSINGALCIFGEIIKQAGNNKDLRPKPHLYLSIMRAFATIGDLDMVKRLNKRMWPDSVGSISRSVKEEADELLMEAAFNNNQIDMARGLLRRIVNAKEWFSWTSRVGMVAVKVETMSGFTNSVLRPHVFPQVVLNDPVEKYMISFQETQPLHADLILEEVAMRFFKDTTVPIVDDWGSCVGVVHRQDCTKIDAPLISMSRGPPLCVPTSTSIEHVIDLLLREKSEMVVVVKRGNMYEGSYASSSRPLGVFSLTILWKFTADESDIDGMGGAACQLQEDVEGSNCG
ncbi:pentatricopeptide repeat-containing protein At5g10690 isoform X2 [Oryza brachyantha]|uniref:pentatricopeptide repeat-containing protein At5g10690 isoform X2 n=1 Tax=Oryza brachyantha TaxID=4533 RepID=UPI001ADC34BE|nr:pentatricopeptide repeat-containing protein At5g10690 isoform X2 [Oryza brachyantha]